MHITSEPEHIKADFELALLLPLHHFTHGSYARISRMAQHGHKIAGKNHLSISTEVQIRQLMANFVNYTIIDYTFSKNLMIDKTELDEPRADKTAVDEIAVEELRPHPHMNGHW